ncbi:hypothetical protein SAMN05421827_102182 [Pedobacter terrae]|uniref:Uncharacterized protein n=1 Tax=Pedobacter terrae TaxID=405671 RepID=A0A1G7Q776_9SPHI|nr:hypothetical protein [Pedobacter terrae]SDF93779.1 hypothetical protein SAMN05421827_102182 [Pedobacter terrae]
MPCPHRYLGLHLPASLLPDWEIDHLFIGTFNPLWDRPNALNAVYFYGRSAYFWDAVSIFFEDTTYAFDRNDRQAMVDFCKRHRMGFTDLILSVEDADQQNQDHRKKIYSVKDVDLESFDQIVWNTDNIKDFLAQKRPANIYFTLLSTDGRSLFSPQILKIEQEALQLGINNSRLHSPTGARLGNGVPRLHQLVERWNIATGLPNVDLARYLYVQNEPKEKKPRKKKLAKRTRFSQNASEIEILIMGRYGLTVSPDERINLFDMNSNTPLKALTVIRDIIIPYISVTFNHQIELHHPTGAKNPKNTRTLGKEVYTFLLEHQ